MKTNYQDLQTRIERETEFWAEKLGIEKLGVHVRHRFNESFADAHHTIIAETDYNWEYRDGTVTWYLPRCASLTDQELGDAALHEYIHCLVASMESSVKQKHSKLCEFAVETMSLAIINVVEGTA